MSRRQGEFEELQVSTSWTLGLGLWVCLLVSISLPWVWDSGLVSVAWTLCCLLVSISWTLGLLVGVYLLECGSAY
jgi:hypothetical protein